MPDDKWPGTPIPKEGLESVKTCSYERTAEKLAALKALKGRAGNGWKCHHKKKGTVSVLVKYADEE